MEHPEPSTPTDIPTVVPHPSTNHNPDTTTAESGQPSRLEHISNSVPSLRFPRPLGNRQLTNWISSSSPDIMQPENIIDDDPSLAELGYDVIGTDGESQAESVASSFDYQRPDDIQSLAGTDAGTDVDTNEVDSESSDDDEKEEVATLNSTAEISAISSTVVEYNADEEDVDVETLVNRSLENPTDVSQHGLPHLNNEDQDQARQYLSETQKPYTTREIELDQRVAKTLFLLEKHEQKHNISESYRMALRYVRGNRRILVVLSGLVVFYVLAVAGKYFLFSLPVPRTLSTVPVAAVSSAAVPPPFRVSSTTPMPTSTWTPTQTHNALQTGNTGNPSSSLAFMTFGKEKVQTSIAVPPQQNTICSAELYDRNEIIVKIPQDIKSAWLARDAILIAVSRGVYDVPTKVSSVEEGFLIEVPLDEAHDILAISIATTRKPKVKETFHVNFGRNKFTGALDAGKQLVRGFAQRLVDTVNETTAWVEETYIPALDVMSKQVCSQTSSVSDSLLQGIKDASNAVFGLPTRLTSQVVVQIKQSLGSDNLVQRQHQAQVQLIREAQDIRDELALRYLSAQLSSKLWWLRIQGKTEEYQRYLSRAEVYLKEKVTDAKVARRERAERAKQQVQSPRQHERHGTRGSFWNKGTGGSQT
ncbi:hypothetical protein AAE478_002821 [Parahypoxylon ruwenzoriense]